MHRNDNVLEILQFSYENDRATAKYAGAAPASDAFLEGLYVDTLLDTALANDILNDEFDLVLITGNPGDGKTAFLDRLFQKGRTTANRPIEILHDATQPSKDDRTALAERELSYFLEDLTDERWDPKSAKRRVRVVGINEGMLARTLRNPKGKYAKHLASLLQKPPLKGTGDFRCATVNLNDRALVHLPLGLGTSLLAKLLHRVTDPRLWEARESGQSCAACPAEATCPLLANARALRLSRPRRQIELLFAIAQFQRHRHISIRDALAALAYLIVGHEDMYRSGERGTGIPVHPCDYIQRAVDEERWGHLYRRLFYHAGFFDGDVFEGYFPELGEADEYQHRLYGFANAFIVEELNVADPVTASNARLDAIELDVVTNASGLLESPPTWMYDVCPLEREFFSILSQRLQRIDEKILAGTVEGSDYEKARESSLALAYVASRAAKRRAFFFDPSLPDQDATPYASLAQFFGVLTYVTGQSDPTAEDHFDEAVESTIPGGVIASERLPVPASPIDKLVVRLSDERGSVGASIEFPVADLSAALFSPTQEEANIDKDHNYQHTVARRRYVEYFPTFLVYRPFKGETQHLIVTLDLYELLFRLRRGYSEAFGHQHRVQQLRIFKAALRARGASRLNLFDAEQNALHVVAQVQLGDASGKRSARVRFQ